ncbi:TPA: hypothetical protein ACGO8I_000156 [Streptococcus suis]|uniref:hypothetical protein n=1 Tax=Streptococcus suis TaxID=1307 RepID=UPI0013A5B3DE|nr:hypothetical protein [Streptococcus suis]MBY4956225.1 hypothetical protein [Streptococcus suis]MBY5017317.1 hypothetical protein [Streptococcus suis]HEM5092557.1 hypothetical protein [Streptococcus suis]
MKKLYYRKERGYKMKRIVKSVLVVGLLAVILIGVPQLPRVFGVDRGERYIYTK